MIENVSWFFINPLTFIGFFCNITIAYLISLICRIGQEVKTQPSHGWISGSIPGCGTKIYNPCKYWIFQGFKGFLFLSFIKKYLLKTSQKCLFWPSVAGPLAGPFWKINAKFFYAIAVILSNIIGSLRSLK